MGYVLDEAGAYRLHPRGPTVRWKMDMTTWQEGAEACKAGKEIWENPHAQPHGRKDDFSAWMAGWCFAEQQKANNTAEKEQVSVVEQCAKWSWWID